MAVQETQVLPGTWPLGRWSHGHGMGTRIGGREPLPPSLLARGESCKCPS